MADSVKSNVKNSIADALQKNGEQFVPLVCEELAHASADVRQCAAFMLGDLGGEPAIRALIAAAYNEQEVFGVREAAMHSLGNIGDRSAIPYLEDLLQSGNRSVVREARAALTGIRQRHPLPRAEN